MSSRKSNRSSETRSEEMQDIISRSPSGLVQWGTLVIFFVFAVLFAISCFIRYPDVITANVTVTTTPSPVTMVSRSAGKLTLLRKENENIEAGDLVAYIQSGASVPDVVALDKTIELLSASSNLIYADSLLTPSSEFKLGDLQPSLTSFITHQHDWSIFKNARLEQKQIIQLKNQISAHQNLNHNQQARQKLMERELVLTKEKFNTDSTLFAQKVISKIDYNQSKSVYLQQQRQLRGTEAEAISTQLQISTLTKQIEEFEASSLTKENQFGTARDLALKELQAQLRKWKESFLFLAPISGTVAYLEYMENNQYTDASKNLFSIVPTGGEIIAKAELPLAGSGKVKRGQQVNIRLDNYPFEQFGMLTGEVKSISLLPSSDKYLVAIILNHGMTSTHHKELPFRQQLKGQTEIITEDLSVIERIFYQFRKLLKQR